MSVQEWTVQVKDFLALNPWAYTVAIIVVGGLTIFLLLIRRSRKRGPEPERKRTSSTQTIAKKRRYEFRLCIVGDKHRWLKTVQNSLTFTFEDKGPPIANTPMGALYGDPHKYEIDPTVSYELDPSFGQRIGMFLRRIDTMFVVVFQEGNKEPIKYQPPKRSAYVLKTIEESQALSNALKKEFAGDFSLKQIFMYLVLIIVGVLAYMFLTGQLVL